MDVTRRCLVFSGFLLVLFGCTTGLAGIPRNIFLPFNTVDGLPFSPAVGVAHTIGCLEGVLLIAAGAC